MSDSDEEVSPKKSPRKRAGKDGVEVDWHEDDMPPMPEKDYLCELMEEPERNAAGDLVLTTDEFRIKYGYSWDYCVVLKRVPTVHTPEGDDPPGFAHVPLTDAGEVDEDEMNDKLKKRGVDKDGMDDKTRTLLKQIKNGGLETMYYASDGKGDELLVLIKGTIARLASFADKIDFKFELDRREVRRRCEEGRPDKKIAPIHIAHKPELTNGRTPYEGLYGKFDTEPDFQTLYALKPGDYHAFDQLTRIKLIQSLLEYPAHSGGCGIKWHKMKSIVINRFPLHDNYRRHLLARKWLLPYQPPWMQPVDDIREYLGEKTALYFAFIGHYSTWCLGISIPGVIFFLQLLSTAYSFDGNQALGLPIFAIMVSLWATLMLEYWKRQEGIKRLEWGMIGFEQEELDRPEFVGDDQLSLIDGSKEVFFSPDARFKRVAASLSVVCVMILLVIAAVAAVFAFRYLAENEYLGEFFVETGATIASGLNAGQIAVMNVVYREIAILLTDVENHRTQTEYEDALIAKIFMFQFVNSYASFYYLAFGMKHFQKQPSSGANVFKNSTEVILEDVEAAATFDDDTTPADDTVPTGECGNMTCMYALMINLITIFGSKTGANISKQAIVPWAKTKKDEFLEKRANRLAAKKGETIEQVEEPRTTQAEEQMNMQPERSSAKNEAIRAIEDWQYVALQFGYVSLFVTAFPIAPLMAFVANCIGIQVEGGARLSVFQRTKPQGAEDIGTWQTVFTIIAAMAVVTNAGLAFFTMGVFSDPSWDGWRVWLFLSYQYVIFGLIYAFMAAVPDVPSDVETQIQRQEFIVEKIIKMAEDDDSEDESSDGDSDREELDESDEEEGEKKKPGCLDKIMPGAGGGAHYGKDRKVEKMIEKVELPGISDREDLLPLLPTEHDKKQLKTVYDKYDKNKNNKLDLEELGALLEEAAGHKLSDDELSRIMLEIDADGSGDISFDEFANVFVRISKGDLVPKALSNSKEQFELLFENMIEDDTDDDDGDDGDDEDDDDDDGK